MKTIVVDDEEQGRLNLIYILNQFCPEVEIVAQADNAATALQLIEIHKPNLLFLDVRMPEMDGFELLDAIPVKDFSVIFVTAHEEYGIKALKASAIDYLLKPVASDDLIAAVEKAKALGTWRSEDVSNENSYKDTLEQLIHDLKKKSKPSRITLPHMYGFTIVDIDQIVKLISDNNYTQVYLADGKRHIISKTMKEFEAILDDQQFVRVHKSHVINLKYLESFERSDGGEAIMKDGTKVEISRRRIKEFIEQVNIYFRNLD
jgi:two-component system LytT family response regulator